MLPHPKTTHLATTDVARRLQKSAERVRQYARAGLLRPDIVLPNGTRLYTVVEVQRFAREQRRAKYAQQIAADEARRTEAKEARG